MKAGFHAVCFRAALVVGVLGLAPAHFISAAPAVISRDAFPGEEQGAVHAKWIAPFVSSSGYTVQGHSETWVRWHDAQGHVVKEVTGQGVSSDNGNGFVREHFGGGTIIHGLSPAWQLGLPDDPHRGHSPDNLERWRASGKIFIRQYNTPPAQTTVEVYSEGLLAGSVGPFFRYKGSDVALGEDGYSSLITWKDAEKKTPQVVVIGPDGKECLRQDCAEDTDFPVAVNHGRGVVLEIEGANPPAYFTYVGADGTHLLFDPKANGYLRATDPASDLILFITSDKSEAEHFQLAHAATGKIAWEIPAPVRQFPNAMTQAIIAGGRVFLLGRDVAAVDLESGQVLGVWTEQLPQPTFGQFYRSGEDIYILTNEEFFKLNPADIAAKRNGWE